jgi:pimeloyl-ACP methyl ester carboxylesterase
VALALAAMALAAHCLTAHCVADFESRKVSVALENGQSIAYVDTGPREGTPVVLIHGYTDSARDWLTLVPYLDRTFRLIIVDLRGQGASAKPECCYSRFDFAYDIELLLRRLHLQRADIVGHSLGSIVAQTFAEIWPEHIRRLVLVSSTGTSFGNPAWLAEVDRLQDPIDPNSQFMRDWWTESVKINPESFSSRQRQDAAAIPAKVWRAIADQSLAGINLAPMLGRIHAPTLLIWGETDSLVSEAARQALIKGIPGSRVKVFHALGHDLFWQDPAGVAALLSEFLTAH